MSPGLKDFLRAWQTPVLPIRTMDFRPSKAVEAAKQVGEGADRQTRPPIDLQKLQAKLLHSARSRDFSGLDILDWRYSTLCLEGKDGLLEDLSLLKIYLKALAQRARGRILRGLARVYVHTFNSLSLIHI